MKEGLCNSRRRERKGLLSHKKIFCQPEKVLLKRLHRAGSLSTDKQETLWQQKNGKLPGLACDPRVTQQNHSLWH